MSQVSQVPCDGPGIIGLSSANSHIGIIVAMFSSVLQIPDEVLLITQPYLFDDREGHPT